MQSAMRIIYAEHRTLSALLSGLGSLARLSLDGSLRPDFALMRSMIVYIETFPERMHHPKEDKYLFSRLACRSPKARVLIDALRSEHAAGDWMVRDLERALDEFEQAWPAGGARFVQAVDEYCRFYWSHMRREETELLPLAATHLTEADWAWIGNAFAANRDPLGDLRENDFEALFQRILHRAPEPIGLGERWERVASGTPASHRG